MNDAYKDFIEKYPKVYAHFWFWRNLFEGIEEDVADTIIVEVPSTVFISAPLWVDTTTDTAIIRVKENIAKELEHKGYFLSEDKPPRKRPIDEEMFHEFLHVLCFYRPEMFQPSCLIIDFVPVWLTHADPPRTVEGLIERIKIINRWWKNYAKGTIHKYEWLKEKYK